MKKVFLFSFLFFFTVNLLAQSVTWKDLPKGFGDSFIKIDDGSFLNIERKRKTNVDLVKYDANSLKESKRVSVDLKRYMENGFHIGGKAYIVTEDSDETGKTTLYLQFVDAETLVLSEAETIMVLSNKKKGYYYSIGVVLSKDQSKVLIYAHRKSNSKEHKVFDVAVFDQNMKKLWQKAIKLKTISKLTEYGEFVVGNNADLYFSTREYKSKKREFVSGKVNFSTKIHAYSENGDSYQKFILKTNQKYYSSLSKLWSSTPGFINFTTLYTNVPKNTKNEILYQGVILQQIDVENSSISFSKMYPFSKAVVFLGEEGRIKAGKKLQKLLDNKSGTIPEMVPKDVVYSAKTGHTTIIFERDYYEINSRSDGNYTTNYSERILCVQFDKDAHLNWFQSINKLQSESVRNKKASLLSYSLHIDGDDNIYFLFNDDKKNTAKRKQNKIPNHYYGRTTSKSGMIAIKLDAQGKLGPEKIVKSAKNTQVTPDFIYYKVNTRSRIIRGRGKGGRKFGLLKLP